MTFQAVKFVSIDLEMPKGVIGSFIKVDRETISKDVFSIGQIPSSLTSAVPKRQNEFMLGRIVANEALKHAGCAELLSNEHTAGQAPKWPVGFTGSITHTNGLIGAVVCKTTDFTTLGLDAESLMSEKTAGRIIHQIVNESEHSHLLEIAQKTGRSVEDTLTLFFSAKEAIYKANSTQFPRRNRFHDVELTFGPESFEFRWQDEEGPVGNGQFVYLPEHVLTLVAQSATN